MKIKAFVYLLVTGFMFTLGACVAEITTEQEPAEVGAPPYAKMAINMFPRNQIPGSVLEQMRDIKALGFISVRVNFWFDTFFMPTADSAPNYTKFTEMIDAAAQENMDVLGILNSVPDWLAGSPDGKAVYIEKFVKPVVSKYKNAVHHWEIWNEPDNPDMLKGILDGSADDYFNLLKDTSAAIRAIDPSATVVAGSTMSIVLDGLGKLNWTKRLIDLGLKDHADVLNIHYYSELDPELGTVVKDTVASAGMRVWVTETGESGLANQLDYFNLTMPYIDASLNPERIYWYCYVEGAGTSQANPAQNTYGIITYEGGARQEGSLYTHLKNR